MIAETILAIFFGLVVLAFLCGEALGAHRAKQEGRRRVERVRRIYVGAMRDW